MVATLVHRFETLRHEDGNKARTNKEREWIEQFVNLNKRLRNPKRSL